MYNEKFIKKDDLYRLSEQEIINLIKKCEDEEISGSFNRFMSCSSDCFVECEKYNADKFCVSRKVKRRYINPLVNNSRVYDISEVAREKIDDYINMKISKFAYLDIEL